MQIVLTHEHGNYKTSVTKNLEIFLGDGIIRSSGITTEYDKYEFVSPYFLKYTSKL